MIIMAHSSQCCKHCFSADKFVIAPELPDFIVAPEVPSEVTSQHYVWPIHLVMQAVTAKYNFVPQLVIQVRDGGWPSWLRHWDKSLPC